MAPVSRTRVVGVSVNGAPPGWGAGLRAVRGAGAGARGPGRVRLRYGYRTVA
ncbi:hypothetical protein KFL01_21340 [Kocuria flava]|uniref:Uncharacterized protein n=1 Tax=Kocuria flava TaxID=446860 RepID=A0ABQ0X5Q4_9MICC|nr:hypothetical protein KFL01_21340 [Kocuria flava]